LEDEVATLLAKSQFFSFHNERHPNGKVNTNLGNGYFN
jgi:hypothetical protein